MKKTINTIMLTLCALLVIYCLVPPPRVYYRLDCHVYSQEAGLAVLEDESGNLWEYETYSELPFECTMVLDNHGTHEIHDDEIVRILPR